jgi:hypothetical protein
VTVSTYHDEVHEDGVEGKDNGGGWRIGLQHLLLFLTLLLLRLDDFDGECAVLRLLTAVSELGQRADDHLAVQVGVVHHQEVVLGGVWVGLPRRQARGRARGRASA